MNRPRVTHIEIRKVRTLKDPLLITAEQALGVKADDLVIVKTTIEKIEGSPIMHLQKRLGPKRRK